MVSNALKFTPVGGKVIVSAEIVTRRKLVVKSPNISMVEAVNSVNDNSCRSINSQSGKYSIGSGNSVQKSLSDKVLPVIEMVRLKVTDSGPGIAKVLLIIRFLRTILKLFCFNLGRPKEVIQGNCPISGREIAEGTRIWSGSVE